MLREHDIASELVAPEGDPALTLSFATWDHDRVMAIHEGRVGIEGVAIDPVIAPTSKLFPIAVQEARYDITEMSVSSYVMQLARGASNYVALPAFVSRAFRHGGFFVRRGSGIRTPADFSGRRIGVPEYQMTAALWMRGILSDDYGVEARDVHWRTGALDAGVRRERLDLDLPGGMQVDPIADGETLQDLFLAGKIDGLLAPKPPAAFLAGDDRLERLFPNFEAVECDYHQRTGFFPIMHVIGIRKSLCDAHSWLPRAVYDALVTARDHALARLREIWLGNANRLSLPWLGASMERTLATMGQDFWSYGFTKNREEIEAICRYSVAQHLAPRRVAAEDLFHPTLLET